MVLIADSGSTKCTWIASDGARTTNVRTRGINAVQHSAEQIREALAELPPCDGVTSVKFYGAGCGETFPEASEKLRRELEAHFGTTDITVESDLLGAARALWGHGEGIACILGTGSNSCLCRDGEILKNVPPLGYVLGDEGSGAVLGRNLVNGIFKGHIPLKEEFLAAHGLNYEEIISRVYREPYANRFLASFAPFIRTHIDRPEIRELVLRSFRDFASRNLSRYPAELPVSLLGGVAAHFEALLREALEAEGRRVETIVESPAEGGSMDTARLADGYNRMLMAVPGRATDFASAGTNLLIRTQRAQMVCTGEDIVREMMWDQNRPGDLIDRPTAAPAALTRDEEGLLGCFRTDDPISAEELCELSGLGFGELSALLLGLEMAGAVRQLPGNRYMKLI